MEWYNYFGEIPIELSTTGVCFKTNIFLLPNKSSVEKYLQLRQFECLYKPSSIYYSLKNSEYKTKKFH